MAWLQEPKAAQRAGSPVLASSDNVMKSCSTACAIAAGVVCSATAIALIGRPSATYLRRRSCSALSPPVLETGETIASTMVGSSTDPPAATSRTVRASWLPSAIRSFNRYA